MPILKTDKQALFVVIDCLRLDQWRALEPIIAPLFDIETTHYFSILPTATPYSRNALFSGLFPGEIAARFPDWWGEREDETLNAHERELLEAQLVELKVKVPVRYEKVSTAAEGDDIERRLARVIAPEGISAFVFNFVDLLTHGRSESAILYEVARDEIALRQLTLAVVPPVGAVLGAPGSGAPQGEGARDERSRLDPLPHAGDGVRQARRDAESSLQVRRGSARRESGAGVAVHE